jgi:hypothetical protein
MEAQQLVDLHPTGDIVTDNQQREPEPHITLLLGLGVRPFVTATQNDREVLGIVTRGIFYLLPLNLI